MRTVDQREERLFGEAIAIDSDADRALFLYEECGTDHALRRRVEKLVALHRRPGFILDSTFMMASDGGVQSIEDDLCGKRMGTYDVIKRMGEGGMGVVYLAEQRQPMKRRVAMKVIKPGMDTRQVIRRFEAERQALALMDHPGITHVYDAGATAAGRPYFVMELVNGHSITDFCDRQCLGIDARLKLFREVCDAVQHAHQKGVIHRDLKPSNILVTIRDGRATPKIIDFGIAKATDQSLVEQSLTAAVDMIGTPDYMSPEQADSSVADVDTRSDIYSLGATLYELVTGATPFSGENFKNKNYAQIQQVIVSREPDRPSVTLQRRVDELLDVCDQRNTDPKTLCRRLQQDLDWIILKSLSRDRDRRYRSAAELSQELQRYLDGDPVEAARPTLGYRFSKFATRYRGVLVATLVLGALLTASTFFSIIAAVDAEAKAVAAQQAEERAKSHLDEANRATQDAEFERQRAADAERSRSRIERDQRNLLARSRAVSRFNRYALEGLLQSRSRDRNVPPEFRLSPWMIQDLGDLSESVVQSSDIDPSADSSEATDGDLRLLRLILEEQRIAFGMHDEFVAATLYKVGRQLLTRNLPVAAVDAFRQSLEIREQIAPNSVAHIESLIGMGTGLSRARRVTEARSHLTRSLALLDALPGQQSLRAAARFELQRLAEQG